MEESIIEDFAEDKAEDMEKAEELEQVESATTAEEPEPPIYALAADMADATSRLNKAMDEIEALKTAMAVMVESGATVNDRQQEYEQKASAPAEYVYLEDLDFN